MMNGVRVVALTTSYPLRAQASAGIFIERLYRELKKSWRIEVICPADTGPVSSIAKCKDGIVLHAVRYAPVRLQSLAQGAGGILPGLRRAPWRIVLVPLLLAALTWRCLRCAARADLIHANWALCGVIAGIVGRLAGKPVVTSLRGDDVAHADKLGLHRLVLRIALGLSGRVVCVSAPMAERLRLQFPRWAERIRVCLNGVDERFFAVERVSGPPDRLRVAGVGSLIRRKGFDRVIEALAQAQYADRLRLRLAGDGPEKATLSALAGLLGVTAQVEFAGELPPEALPRFFAEADLLVLPSRSEGRPNVVLEALASGLPVIASDLPGVRDLIHPGINGWIVEGEDPAEWARILDWASANPDSIRRMGQTARLWARDQLGSWADTASAYETVFRQVLATRGSDRIDSCAE